MAKLKQISEVSQQYNLHVSYFKIYVQRKHSWVDSRCKEKKQYFKYLRKDEQLVYPQT